MKKYWAQGLLILVLAGLLLGAVTNEDYVAVRVDSFGQWSPGETYSSNPNVIQEIGNYDYVKRGDRFILAQRMGFDNWSSTPTPSGTKPSLFYLYKTPTRELVCAGVGGELYYSRDATNWTHASNNHGDLWDDGATSSALATAITFKDTMIMAGNDKICRFEIDTVHDVTAWGYPILALHQDRIYATGSSADPNKVIYRPEFDIDFDSLDTKVNSGFFYVGYDDGDVIRAIVSMNSYLIVFKAHSIFRVTISPSTNTPYEVIKVHSSIGTLSPYTVTEYNNNLYFVNDYGVYAFDGQNVTKLSQQIDSWFADSVKASGGSVALLPYFGIAAMEGKLYVTTYEQGSVDAILVYDMVNRIWWKYWFPTAIKIGRFMIPYQANASGLPLVNTNLPSLGGGTGMFQRPRFLFWTTDTVYIYPWGPKDWATTSPTTWVRSSLFDLGDTWNRKRILRVSPVISANAGTLAMGFYTDTLSGSNYSFTFGTGTFPRVRNKSVDPRVTGSLLGYSFTTTGMDSGFVHGIEFGIRRLGGGLQD